MSTRPVKRNGLAVVYTSLRLAGGGLAADASGHVFETAGLQIKIELAVIREDEFVVSSALQPHMTIGLGVAGLVDRRKLYPR